MDTYELTQLAFREQKPRQLGRFKVSDVWAILNGYLPPEKYFEIEHIDNEQMSRMQYGIMWHDYFSTLLEKDGWICDQEKLKQEYHYKDIVLVGIPDGIKDDVVLEMKTKMDGLVEEKKWYITQVKCYLSMYNKKIGIIAQPHIDTDIYLRFVKEVKRNDTWFNGVLDKLVEYNETLKKLSTV